MANKKSTNSPKKQVKKKNNNGKLIIIAAAAILLFVGVKYFSSANTKSPGDTQTSSANKTAFTAAVEIKKADITSQAKFYPYEADGIKMELLALKASDGSVRTAFNTCQVCYSSGKGYYVQEGNELVCQNCGNRFAADQVGVKKGGCNPVPISSSSKTEDDNTIKIDKGFLDNNKAYFSNWKTS